MRLCDVNAVQALLGFYIDGVSFFRRLVGSKRMHSAINRKRCSPPASILGNSDIPGAGPSFASVAHVLSSGSNPKVAQPVVVADAVDVVNLSIRINPVDVQPSKSVQGVVFVGYLRSQIAGSVCGTNYISNFDGANRADTPSKNTRLGIVMKKFAQSFCGKIGLSHEAVLSLIGQRPDSVRSGFGPRYFSMGGA